MFLGYAAVIVQVATPPRRSGSMLLLPHSNGRYLTTEGMINNELLFN